MTIKALILYAFCSILNSNGVHSFTISNFETSALHILAQQRDASTIKASTKTTSRLFYNDKRHETDDSEQSSLWLPSSKNSEEARLLKMKEDMIQFATQTKADLRSDIKQMKENLALSLATDDLMRIVALTKSIKDAQEKDPEYIYTRALERIADANNVGKYSTKRKYEIISQNQKEADMAREYIPRLNMHGLWIANFGQGAELVNVTYSGDTLVAMRLKSPDSVFFQADLSPREYSTEKKGKHGNTVRMANNMSSKMGVDNLDRYPGEGIDALNKKPKSADPVDGNLIMFDGYFSFLWIPTRQHVFFSKPKGNRIFELLRDTISEEDELQNMRDHVSSCFDVNIDDAILKPTSPDTTEMADPFRRIATKADLFKAKQETRIVYNDFPLRDLAKRKSNGDDNKQSQSFWAFHKWMSQIDNALNNGEVEKNKKQ